MNKLILIILIAFAMPSSISDVISKHSNGRPKEVHLYDVSGKKIILREKKHFYENGQVKAKGIFLGNEPGRWIFYSNDGRRLLEPIELIDENNQNNIHSRILTLIEADEAIYNKLKQIKSSNESIKVDYNATIKKYERFDLRLTEQAKQIKTLEDQIQVSHEVVERMKLDIEQLEERLIQKLDRLKDDIMNISDSFDSYKRTANRTTREMKLDISTLIDDYDAIDRELHPEKYEDEDKK